MSYYILNGKIPVEEPDILAWDTWRKNHSRIVRKDFLNAENTILVSTVFLGIDQRFTPLPNPPGPPILFETIIFGLADMEDYQERCCTWEEAEEMHREALRALIKVVESDPSEDSKILVAARKALVEADG